MLETKAPTQGARAVRAVHVGFSGTHMYTVTVVQYYQYRVTTPQMERPPPLVTHDHANLDHASALGHWLLSFETGC